MTISAYSDHSKFDPYLFNTQNCWLVNLPQCGEKDDIATISIKEEDLREIQVMYAKVNEEIKSQFDELEKKSVLSMTEDISSYLV